MGHIPYILADTEMSLTAYKKSDSIVDCLLLLTWKLG